MHDESAQTLTSLLLYLKLLSKSQNPEEAQRTHNLRQLTAHALEEIRRVAMELHPRILDDGGLEAALERRIDELNSTNSLQAVLSVEGGVQGRLPKDLELAFYRVTQEALNNVVRHSHAQHVHVTLSAS
jgi:two-component system sensor histidine kinase UhpB